MNAHQPQKAALRPSGRGIALAAGLFAPLVVQAGAFDLAPGVDAEYRLTLNYALSMRTKAPTSQLVSGPTDPATGLPTTVNGDDGDRNFKADSLTNDRVSALAELRVSTEHYGIVASGTGFYDQAYHGPNDNDSPATVNKTGPNNRFTTSARYFEGQRVRALDAYAYGNWAVGDGALLDLRGGRQAVAWGESLFFSGIASAQSPYDQTKSFVPGVEVKDLLLPTNQISARLTDGKWALLGYYKFQYKATELVPSGDYFSINDGIGPGATFLYGFANPLAQLAAVVPGTPATINVPLGQYLTPSDYGQWGTGLKYQVTPTTNLGVYYLRYSNTNPEVVLGYGYAQLLPPVTDPATQQIVAALLHIPPAGAGILAQGVSTFPQQVPVSYDIKYYDGIHLYGTSFSSIVGAVQVAGEVNYRDGIDTLLQGDIPTRGKMTQALLSALYTFNPNGFWDDASLAAETGYLHVNGVDAVAGNQQLANSRNAWGYEALFTMNFRNVVPAIDLSVPLSFAALAKGTPAMAGAFGSLYGEGDQRASIGLTATWLQMIEVGFSYNAFLGSPNLNQHPYADRDYVAFNVKYSL